MFASRLANVMNPIISSSQLTFLKGRHLMDGVLIVNEAVELAKRSKRERVTFKVDSEKGYDSVD